MATRKGKASNPSSPRANAGELRRIRKALLDWYGRERRDLPWRREVSPYRTVVSEFMLQQTQVASVIPYFEAFILEFPNFEALARASEEAVLAAWSGLGYYRRARALKRAAEKVNRLHHGQLPSDPAALRALPGFGDYTAAAVGSIALGLPMAAIDGNVRRVIARLFAVEAEGEKPSIAELSGRLLARRRPGDWNQAMMELGATVCTPREPRCLICPLRRRCRALALGRANEFPNPRKQPAVRHIVEVAVAVQRRGRILVLQRGEDQAFAGMWELPRLDSRQCDEADLNPRQVLFELTRLKARYFTPIGESHATFTHHRIHIHLYRVEGLKPGAVRRQRHIAQQWVRPEELDTLAASKTQRRLFRLIRQA